MIGSVFECLSANFDLLDLLTLLQFVGIILIAVAASTDKRKTAAIGAIIAGIGSVGRSFSMLSIYADIAKISVWRTISILHQQGLLVDFLFFDLLAEAAGYFLLAILCGSRKQLRWPGFLSAALFAVAPFLLLSSLGFPYNGTGTVSYLCRIAGAILYTFYSSDKEVAS
jgi:hypothetical protein